MGVWSVIILAFDAAVFLGIGALLAGLGSLFSGIAALRASKKAGIMQASGQNERPVKHPFIASEAIHETQKEKK